MPLEGSSLRLIQGQGSIRGLGYASSSCTVASYGAKTKDEEPNRAEPNHMVEFSTLPKIGVPRNSRGMDDIQALATECPRQIALDLLH